jgi:hypothetical protein
MSLGVAVALVACADLFGEPSQCKTDDDCAKFDAVCDIGRAVCVDREGPEGGEDSSVAPPKIDAPDDRVPNRCAVSPKPAGTIGTALEGGSRAITGSLTLGCDKDWTLEGRLFVRSGATLTIEAGTTIRAKKGVGAAIIVSTGGRIVAQGSRDAPIVLTSDANPPAPGDWRGIYLLGLAPPTGLAPYEDDPDLPWGGDDADDGSGTLSFVRIEYAKRGLAFVGAGKKTKIDFVEVRRTVDNCFTFHGGTADAKHLVCQSPGNNQFEWYLGYTGRAQFLFGQKAAPPPIFNSDGILVDDARPVIHNATICGDEPTALNGYGVVFRDNGTLNLSHAIVSGWFAGMDATGTMPDPGRVRASIFFGNATNPAYAEGPGDIDPNSPAFDDDEGFDELAAFGDVSADNSVNDPKLVDCFDAKSPKPWPALALTTTAAPPADGFFDPNAKYAGAFKDATDSWASGSWVRFDDK